VTNTGIFTYASSVFHWWE